VSKECRSAVLGLLFHFTLTAAPAVQRYLSAALSQRILWWRALAEKQRRLVAVLDRSERDVPRRGEGAWGAPESKRTQMR
jgi:hypothetical protein